MFLGVLATSSEALTGSPYSQAVLGSCGESEDAVFFQCSLMAFPRPCEVPEAHGKTSLCDKISPSLARDRSSLENGGERTIFCFAGRVRSLRFWFTGEDCGKAGRLREQTPVNARPSVGRSQTAGLSAGPIRSGDLLAR